MPGPWWYHTATSVPRVRSLPFSALRLLIQLTRKPPSCRPCNYFTSLWQKRSMRSRPFSMFAISGSGAGLKVEQLSPVAGEVQVKTLVMQIIAGAFVELLTQQVFHRPVVRRQMLDG